MDNKEEKEDVKKDEKIIEDISKTIEAHKKKNFFKKVWYSITKIERYLEMAAEGVFRAISYLLLLNLIGVAIISAITTVELRANVDEFSNQVVTTMPDIVYENGKLEVDSEETLYFEGENGMLKVITNTNEITQIEELDYLDQIDNSYIGVLILEEYVVINVPNSVGEQVKIYYSELDLRGKIDNNDIANYLTGSQMSWNYISVFAIFSLMLLRKWNCNYAWNNNCN